MDKKELKRLEQSNPIIQVATELGLKVRDNMGRCFNSGQHSENQDPTLFFNVAKNSFLCKTCADVNGGVIDFVCQYQGWDRQKAIDWLVHRGEFDLKTRDLYYGRGTKK